MEVLVAGANGKIGRRLVRMLVEDGHQVRGLVRKEEQLPAVERNGAEPVLVDLESEEADGAVGEAVEGCGAIIFAAGAGPGSGAARKETMDYGGAAKLVEAACSRGVGRYVMVSALGADGAGSGSDVMSVYLRAKASADRLLQQSGLAYTVVRPGGLTDGRGRGRIAAAATLGRGGSIPREDVARVLAACLRLENTEGKTFELVSGDTPVEEALRAL